MTESEPDAHLYTRTEARIDQLGLRHRVKALTGRLGRHRTKQLGATRELRTVDRLMAELNTGGLGIADLARLTGIHEATIRKHIRRHKDTT